MNDKETDYYKELIKKIDSLALSFKDTAKQTKAAAASLEKLNIEKEWENSPVDKDITDKLNYKIDMLDTLSPKNNPWKHPWKQEFGKPDYYGWNDNKNEYITGPYSNSAIYHSSYNSDGTYPTSDNSSWLDEPYSTPNIVKVAKIKFVPLDAYGKPLSNENTKVSEQSKASVEKTEPVFFKGNCTKWHEVIDENHLFASQNGERFWHYSEKSAAIEFECEHQHDRLYPCFTESEMEQVKETIVQYKKGVKAASEHFFSTSINKSTIQFQKGHSIDLNGIPFHYNSGEKIWFIGLPMHALDDPNSLDKKYFEHAKEMLPSNILFISPHAFMIIDHAIAYTNHYSQTIKKEAKQKVQQEKQDSLEYKFIGYMANHYNVYVTQITDYDYSTAVKKFTEAHNLIIKDMTLAKAAKDKKHYETCVKFLEFMEERFAIAENLFQSVTKSKYKTTDLYKYLKN